MSTAIKAYPSLVVSDQKSNDVLSERNYFTRLGYVSLRCQRERHKRPFTSDNFEPPLQTKNRNVAPSGRRSGFAQRGTVGHALMEGTVS